MSQILVVPNPLLRKKSLPVEKIDKNAILFSKRMIKIMNSAPGVGLAAPQLGKLERIITINIRKDNEMKDNSFALFNPSIISFSKKKIVLEEGCLSVPGQFAEIERSESIRVKYLNESSKEIEKEVSGFESRVIQHEVDHLEGRLFIDYLSPLKRNIMIKKVIKLEKVGNFENK